MRVIQVLETLREIESALDIPWWITATPEAIKDEKDSVTTFTFRLAQVSGQLRADSEIWAVAKSFGLDELMTPDFIAGVHRELSRSPTTGVHLERLRAELRALVNARETLARLVFPKWREVENRPDTISLEVYYPEGSDLDAITAGESTTALTDLYDAFLQVAKATEKQDFVAADADQPLRLLKIESGSSLRIDCRGIGAVVKEVKKFFLDLWEAVYHRESNRLQANVRAAVESMTIIGTLGDLKDNGRIEPEEAELLKRKILRSTEKLFEHKALPPEVHAEYSKGGRLLLSTSPTNLLSEANDDE